MTTTARAALLVLVTVTTVGLVSGCSDDDGRAGQAGNVSAPPVSLDATTTTTTTTSEPERELAEVGVTELEGTAWLLQTIDEGDGPVDASESPVPAVMTFGSDSVDIYDGVNTAAGRYSVRNDQLSIEVTEASELPYPAGAPQYELIGHLRSVENAALQGRMLVLISEESEMTFELAGGGVSD